MTSKFEYDKASKAEQAIYDTGYVAGARDAKDISDERYEDGYDEGYADGQSEVELSGIVIAEALGHALDGEGALALVQFQRALGGGNVMPVEAELRRRGFLARAA